MKLSYRCDSCKMENYITTKSNNRHELLKNLGTDHINESCNFCNHENKKHLNRLHADINKGLIVIAFSIALIMSMFLCFNYGYIIFILFAIPSFVFFDQQKKASNFNRTVIK